MNAILLCAGRGERLRPLTDTTPKPLAEVSGRPLLDYALGRLQSLGIGRVVINVSWLREQIIDYVKNGDWGSMEILISDEGDNRLGVIGGIVKALPLLGDEPFLAVNGDLYCEFDLSSLSLKGGDWGTFVLVPADYEQGLDGDFALFGDRVVDGEPRSWVFSGISLLSPRLFQGAQILVEDETILDQPFMQEALAERRIAGLSYTGNWFDAGTAERLQNLRNHFGI